MATALVSGVQYSGIWNISSQANAKAAGTWPVAGVGSLYAWGSNVSFGQLGLGDTTNRSSPTIVGASASWLNVAAGSYFSGGIKTDGSLYMWGQNNQGQLGIGNITSFSSPKQVGSLTSWSKVFPSIKGEFAFAIKNDGTLWTMGFNVYGQLGLGDGTSRSSPVQIGSLATWLSINSCSSAYHTAGTLE